MHLENVPLLCCFKAVMTCIVGRARYVCCNNILLGIITEHSSWHITFSIEMDRKLVLNFMS